MDLNPAPFSINTCPAHTEGLAQQSLNDLSKWETNGNWIQEEEHVLAIEPRPGEEGWKRFDDYLWSKKQYGNFALELEYKIPEDGNSGVFVRVREKDDPVETGIEVQINDVYGKEELSAHDCGGVIGTVGFSKNMAKPADEWNAYASLKGFPFIPPEVAVRSLPVLPIVGGIDEQGVFECIHDFKFFHDLAYCCIHVFHVGQVFRILMVAVFFGKRIGSGNFFMRLVKRDIQEKGIPAVLPLIQPLVDLPGYNMTRISF